MKTWEERFHELAENFVETDGMLRLALNQAIRSRGELLVDYRNTSPKKREMFEQWAKEIVAKLMAPEAEIKNKPLKIPTATLDKLKDARAKQMKEKMPLKVVIPEWGKDDIPY